jgi:hypothetical protein
MKIVLMKGQVKVSGQKEYLNPTSPPPTSDLKSDDNRQYQDHPPPPSSPGISQELIGTNDDIYRLFVVPFS